MLDSEAAFECAQRDAAAAPVRSLHTSAALRTIKPHGVHFADTKTLCILRQSKTRLRVRGEAAQGIQAHIACGCIGVRAQLLTKRLGNFWPSGEARLLSRPCLLFLCHYRVTE